MRKIIFLLLLLPILSFGQIPEPQPNTYVNDLSGNLSADQLHNLNETILAIEKKSSVQIAVILLDKLPDDMSIEDYAMQVGRKWHVGNAANGLVYVAAISQRKQRLEVARALEYQITDVDALHITDNVKPFFRKQDYYGGVNNLLKDISEKLDPVLQEQLALAKVERDKKNEMIKQRFFTAMMWIAGLGVIAGIIFIPIYRRRKKAREEKEEKEAQERRERRLNEIASMAKSSPVTKASNTTIIAPVIIDDPAPYRPSSYSSGSSSSSSSDSGSSYGNWGSGSSDSGSSSSSDFSGGGSSNDW